MMKEGVDQIKTTWVLVEEVMSGNWGVGGKALGLEGVKAMQQG